MKIINYLLATLLAFLSISCVPKEIANDTTKNQKIANEVVKYLEDCPSFFLPPSPLDPFANGIEQNKTGAVAWTPSGLVGSPWQVDTKEEYIQRINKASVSNQTNWNQYQSISGRGFPGYEDTPGGTQHPEDTYQAGYVCYALVYRAVVESDFDPWGNFPTDCDELISSVNLHYYPDSQAHVGDIVVYDWNND